MYVLKVAHPEYSWGYCVKGWPHIRSQIGWFSEHEVFATEQEAKDYIQVLLKDGKSEWFAPVITEDCFEIVEVRQYKDEGLGDDYFTEKEYKNTKDAI